MGNEQIIVEARARIFWGDSPQSVRDYLLSNGISSSEADRKIEAFNNEREKELRRIGLRYLVSGAVFTAPTGITLYIGFRFSSLSSGYVRALVFVLLVGLYGFWKLVKGIVYLVRPQFEHKSIPDIEASDILE
jgi:hypothetical protein